MEINNEIITSLIYEHEKGLIPRYRRLQNIYEGKHEVLNRTATEGKPNNKLVIDFQGYITKLITSYFMGEKVLYNSINSDTDKDEELLDILHNTYKLNNEHKENTEIATELSVKGEAFEILYINDNKDVEFVQVAPEEMIVKYGSSVKKKLELALRHYNVKDLYTNEIVKKIEIYTKDKIQYLTQVDDDKYRLDDEIEHHFKEVPVIHYINNKEKTGDWEKVLSLINELENRLSDNANELQAFRESYLLLKGVDMSDEQVQSFRESSAMSMRSDGDASFLTKDINDTFAENHINRLIDLIHTSAMIPDLSDENFGNNVSGISIKFKLYSLEAITSIKESYFKEALTRRIRLITSYINYIELEDYNHNDIEIILNRNVPANMTELVDNSLKLLDVVSKETVLEQLPFITNVNEEIDRIEEEEEKMYGSDLLEFDEEVMQGED